MAINAVYTGICCLVCALMINVMYNINHKEQWALLSVRGCLQMRGHVLCEVARIYLQRRDSTDGEAEHDS